MDPVFYEFTKIDDKSDRQAVDYRQEGNQLFCQKKWFKALTCYNKSIAFAEKSELLALAYGNRSALYFEIKLYEECLQNIQWAREKGFPKDKLAKLDEREANCKKLMRNMKPKKDPWEFFKLSYPANKKIPWIVGCVEMRWTKDFGRGIYATRDLKAGDIISIEKPLVYFQNQEVRYRNCYNCGKVGSMNLHPSKLNASIMFCSTECEGQCNAKGPLHILAILQDDIKIYSELCALLGGQDKFDAFVARNGYKNLKKSVFDYDLSNPNDEKYKENLVSCFLSLASSGQIEYAHYQRYNRVKQFVPQKFAEYIWKLYFSNYKQQTSSYKGGQITYPKTMSLFTSLINHSCASNANVGLLHDKIVTVVKCPIKAGEQIFLNYFHKIDCHNSGNIYFDVMKPLCIPKCNCAACKGILSVPALPNERILKYWAETVDAIPCDGLEAKFKEVCAILNKTPLNMYDTMYGFTATLSALVQVYCYPHFFD